jgi:hypothetical protein
MVFPFAPMIFLLYLAPGEGGLNGKSSFYLVHFTFGAGTVCTCIIIRGTINISYGIKERLMKQ